MASVPGSSRMAATASLAMRPSIGIGEVAPPEPDDVRHPRPPPVEQAHRLLGTRPRRRHHAHPTRLDHVGEPEADAAQHGRPGARAHHQPSALGRPVLQLDLVVHRDVVAEQQHVEAGRQGLVGLQGGVVAGHRDHRHVGVGLQVEGLLERPGLAGLGLPAADDDRAANSFSSATARACSAVPSSDALAATNKSLAPAPPRSPLPKPFSTSVSTLAAVAIADAAQSTPSTSSMARVPDICSTESRYVPRKTLTRRLAVTSRSPPAGAPARCGCR